MTGRQDIADHPMDYTTSSRTGILVAPQQKEALVATLCAHRAPGPNHRSSAPRDPQLLNLIHRVTHPSNPCNHARTPLGSRAKGAAWPATPRSHPRRTA